MTELLINPANPPAPATTTSEEDLYTASHRKINFIWEFTQAAIAISVVAVYLGISYFAAERAAQLNPAFFLVIGFYFGRTNHARTSGEEGSK